MVNKNEKKSNFKGCSTEEYQLLLFIERNRCGTQRKSALTQELISEAFRFILHKEVSQF